MKTAAKAINTPKRAHTSDGACEEEMTYGRVTGTSQKHRDVYQTLGPGSRAELATALAFGSLFTAPYKGYELYIDIHESPRDQTMQSLIEKISFLPFVPEIKSAGKEFASKTIKSPFLCAQLRLLDGQFKNHWKTTFLGLQQKTESLRHEDLPQGNWTGSYLEDLSRDSDSFKLHVLREKDELVTRTAKNLAASAKEMKFGFLSVSLDRMKKNCCPPYLPDMLLYIEEAVCSCASLGFVGTAGSTIAVSIELMRTDGLRFIDGGVHVLISEIAFHRLQVMVSHWCLSSFNECLLLYLDNLNHSGALWVLLSL
ncbi:hypothetical protein HYC85_023249 [Camellia sinensis]|uniref:Uncharacterized protein n=1 Tax=Camellia sinensis TaxID=4442 RepID=A0A7J7GE32_CAMSI|nr:hypothetical protein HYC85_023249 [Camellia sinensis]